ncbi:MAG: hypothetical protein ACTHNS_12805 [Marmoricola sp.]
MGILLALGALWLVVSPVAAVVVGRGIARADAVGARTAPRPDRLAA